MPRGHDTRFCSAGKSAAGRDWGMVPGDLVRYQTEAMGTEQEGRVLAVGPLAISVDDCGWLRPVPASAWAVKVGDAPAGWAPPAWYVRHLERERNWQSDLDKKLAAPRAAINGPTTTEDTDMAGETSARICGICKKPLPADANPRRRIHQECKAVAKKLMQAAWRDRSKAGAVSHACRRCGAGGLDGVAKLCPDCKTKTAASKGHKCQGCETRIKGRAMKCEACKAKKAAGLPPRPPPGKGEPSPDLSSSALSARGNAAGGERQNESRESRRLSRGVAGAAPLASDPADPEGDREYAEMMRHVRKPSAGAEQQTCEVTIRLVMPAAQVSRVFAALAKVG
jgi:hypothetical protein